jgi:hypothetical protein
MFACSRPSIVAANAEVGVDAARNGCQKSSKDEKFI